MQDVFVTPDEGLYDYVRMQFTQSNYLATFQQFVNEFFQTNHYNTNPTFLDDVLKYSKTAENHVKHPDELFLTLCNANLKLKPKRCHLFQRQVVYVGHVIGVECLSPNLEKTSVPSLHLPVTIKGSLRILHASRKSSTI